MRGGERKTTDADVWRVWNLGKLLLVSGFGVVLAWSTAASAQQYDPTPAWPLCGRIAETPPQGWAEADGCPSERWGDPAFTDLPLESTYGPRELTSENSRYDFHRGIDIPTPIGTPVFAIADGEVIIAGNHSGYSDPLVQLRHFRPGLASCSGVGCYHSNYMHLSGWAVAADDVISKGDLIGYTGESASGFDHLHFELRDAPADDVFSRWQRDTVHTLFVLPYQDATSPTVTLGPVDQSDPLAPVVEITVTAQRVDINRAELYVYDDATLHVTQPGNTPDTRGYNVYPSWFDMDVWNRQYTHKDSTNVPWESFGAGGVNECPYYADHGASYNANVHMDAQDPADFHDGLFNGVTIRTADYDPPADYFLGLTFHELVGPARCVAAKVTMTDGDTATQTWGDWGGLAMPVGDAQQLVTAVGTPLAILLTANDDNDDPLTFEVVVQPLNGVLSGDGANLVYTPDAGFEGVDDIAFVARDPLSESAVAVVDITVGAPTSNNPPVATDDEANVAEDGAITIAVLDNDSDADGDSLAVTVVTQGADGAVAINADDTVTYTPNADFNGVDSFDYTVSDGEGGSDSASVSITVTALNDAPVADGQSVNTKKNTPLGFTLTASDADSDALVYTIVLGPSHGTLSGSGASLTYTPDNNYTGIDSFDFGVDDGNGGADSATVSISVKKGGGGSGGSGNGGSGGGKGGGKPPKD